MAKKTNNVLVIPDLHIPYQREGALEFILKTKKEYKCDTVISIGDIVDQYYFSNYDHDCEEEGLLSEMVRARAEIKRWGKAFPRLTITYGNHDLRLMRKAKRAGIPCSVLKGFNEIYGTPKGWSWVSEIEIDGVLYSHGDACGGQYSHMKTAEKNRQSCVVGHSHKGSGVGYLSCHKDLIWGLNVGCLVDDKAFAFNYAKSCLQKSILGCGVVMDSGRFPLFVPMPL